MKITILSTDTLHHRYFINSINKEFGLYSLFLETVGLDRKRLFVQGVLKAKGLRDKIGAVLFSPYWQLPFLEKKEHLFENRTFFKSLDREFPEGLSILRVQDINGKDAVERLRDIAPDVVILFGVSKVGSDIIRIPRRYILNIHRGIVPAYRGLDSDLWAVYFDDPGNIGVTVHLVEETLDTGGVVYQERLNLTPEMKLYQLRYYTTVMATEMVLKALRDIEANRLRVCSQGGKGGYFSFMPYLLKLRTIRKFSKIIKQLKMERG